MSQQVFLSHDSRDRELAKITAETVSRVSLKQIEIWYSSDSSSYGGLKPGQVWINEIRSRLLASRAILILLTPNSVQRPWVYFESGFGYFNQECQVVPICVGISLTAVPDPLAMFQCYELNSVELFSQFCMKFFSYLQINFDEEMASPVLRSATSVMRSFVPEPLTDVDNRTVRYCDTISQLEILSTMLRTMYDQLPMMVHSIDETGVICEVNQKWLDTLGYQREEVIGKPANFLMTTASAELAMLVVIPEFWERGFCKDVPYVYKKKDGSTINVILNCVATTDENGKRVSLSFVQDASSDQFLKQQMEKSKSDYDQWLQEQMAGFYETDLFGNFTAVNDSLSQLLGFERKEELLGRNFRDVIDSESAKYIFNLHHLVFTSRASRKGSFRELHVKNGRTITVESVVSLLTDASGTAHGFRGVFMIVKIETVA